MATHSNYSCLENPRDGGAWWAAVYIFGGSKITANGDCSHEIKRLLGRKVMTSKGVTLLLYQNRALEQTLVKMPVPWAGLAPCPLPPQQTPEPAYPTSPAFPPLSCPFASRVVYQDGFYGAEIYVSAAPGVKSEREVAQSCLTLCDPMDCSPPGSSIQGIFQVRVLEWGAIAFSVQCV